MRFRVVIQGKALGFLPVRLTPIDVAVPPPVAEQVAVFVAGVKPASVRFTGFSGSVSLEIKSLV